MYGYRPRLVVLDTKKDVQADVTTTLNTSLICALHYTPPSGVKLLN